MKEVARRLGRALRTWPDGMGWRRVLIELLWALPVLALIGWAGGLARFEPTTDPALAARLMVLLFFVPALGEELLFRGALLPDPGAERRPIRVVLAIALFVAWHPLQAYSFGPPWAALFLDPWFLAGVAVLGVALSRMYLATGSLWPSVLTHWLAVAAWKLIWGGPLA